MWFQNSVHVKAPLYVTRDLHLESTAVVDGAAQKAAIGRDLYLKNPQNQIGLTGGSDPRIAELHVVRQCSSKKTPALHTCGPLTRRLGRRRDLRDGPRQRHSAGPAAVHLLHPEAHLLRALRRNDRPGRPSGRSAGQPEQHGLLVPERRSRAAVALHDVDRLAAEVRHGERSPGQLDQLERDSHHGDQPDAGAPPTRAGRWRARRSWASSPGTTATKLLTVKGTIFIDGSITIDAGRDRRDTQARRRSSPRGRSG